RSTGPTAEVVRDARGVGQELSDGRTPSREQSLRLGSGQHALDRGVEVQSATGLLQDEGSRRQLAHRGRVERERSVSEAVLGAGREDEHLRGREAAAGPTPRHPLEVPVEGRGRGGGRRVHGASSRHDGGYYE